MADSMHTWDQERFDKLLGKKYELLQQNADSTRITANAHENVANLQYGPGGSADRIASMTYGPGGMYDRNTTSAEGIARMQQPSWNAEADLKRAQARGANYTTDLTSWIAGLKDTEGNSLLGRQKGIEFNVLRSANPNLPGVAGNTVAAPNLSMQDNAELAAQTSPEAFNSQGSYIRTSKDDINRDPDPFRMFNPSYLGSLFTTSPRQMAAQFPYRK
jgi:hypothetical protein